ncbi:PREDICTED: uncharacterized protein LOC105556279 [Vollenhovia emeryi]|uniref:uncharacterized protein LOC105556279 n=1 Tax=Vollenhovia emeryi TaxID=411798 RepID=UPI0005F44819|nr:PREDICTED: uncharacterized protein LOC105556279 [Vollenhovia emeryi]
MTQRIIAPQCTPRSTPLGVRYCGITSSPRTTAVPAVTGETESGRNQETEKLDSSTRLLWESSRELSQDFPSFSDLKDFLSSRARALDAANPRVQPVAAKTAKPRRSGSRDDVSLNATSTGSNDKSISCPLCREQHAMRSCTKFKALSVENRREQVRKRKACSRQGLGQGHVAAACPSSNRYRLCNEPHHTLLHGGSSEAVHPKADKPACASTASDKPSPSSNPTEVTALSSSVSGTVLLATAIVKLYADAGQSVTARALLDSGSEASFVSERVAQQLKLSRRRANVTVCGLQGVNTGRATHSVSLLVGSIRSPSMRVALPRVLVLPRLTTLTPRRRVQRGEWPHLRGLELADPEFDQPSKVDIVLGADVYGFLLQGGVKRGATGDPSAHSTVFGWVLMGPISEHDGTSGSTAAVHHAITLQDLHSELRRFWEIEEVSGDAVPTPEDAECEKIFAESHSRSPEGRYLVRLPRTTTSSVGLGESRPGALKMLLSTERRLERNPPLKTKYQEFMDSYLTLGHMEHVAQDDARREVYYMPHHAVVKQSDPEGKIRVVFNASFRTSSGASLNDLLLPGPKLQADIWLVLTRWRLFQFAFTADIVKMFRQIRIHPDDADLQRIVWRADPSGRLLDYRLTTVTYGTASAPYLAHRTLLQLARDESSRFPRGAQVVHSHMYVDDVLAGASTIDDTLEVQRQTAGLLNSGGFPLGKWAASHAALQPNDGPSTERLFTRTDCVGALGIIWTPTQDTLRLRAVPTLTSLDSPTKRTILSDVARLFDPAAWAAPALVGAKILLQDLWTTGLDWDQRLPPPLEERWRRFAAALPDLEGLRIPRWTGVSDLSSVQLHGFSDASERAYSATVFVRGPGPADHLAACLLMAKTKVAPVKPLSVPRLELRGALLTARLLSLAAKGLNIPATAYMVGRMPEWYSIGCRDIHHAGSPGCWRHVSTAENPADAATRGFTPTELANLRLWWKGPPWLELPSECWPCDARGEEGGEERQALPTVVQPTGGRNELLDRFSSPTKLIRVSAFCLRLLRRPNTSRSNGLSTAELNDSLLRWLRIAQAQDYAGEIERLSTGASLPKRSPLAALRPILGPDGLLRVGGRLERASLSYDERHPVILARNNALLLLLVRDAHQRTLHGGSQLTHSVLRPKYWVVHARSLIRAELHRCVPCSRFRGQTATQQMGQLPADRVLPTRPFNTTGVDYAGPILLRTSKGRGHKAYKGYICLFVCMATRAIHLEAVSNLTTDSFLAAFKRFVARRGRCSRLVSDNGTNFHGADKELRALFKGASESFQMCRNQLAADGTEWSFIPPSAPHFGGLWEAGVRSTKHHLRRVLGSHTLTYEELSTLLSEIEACLNSRPLHPMSGDASDLAALTPGHFLIGEAQVNVPRPSTLTDPPRSLNLRWRLVTNMRDHFWSRWSRKYLHHLQQLGKWRQRLENVQPGELVLIKDELQPPAKWALGRVRQVHPGGDGLTRVVSLDTSSTTLTRPITKVVPLPVSGTQTEDKP